MNFLIFHLDEFRSLSKKITVMDINHDSKLSPDEVRVIFSLPSFNLFFPGSIW